MKTPDQIIKYCVDHPDTTTEEIAKKFKLTTNNAFFYICEAGKRLGKIK